MTAFLWSCTVTLTLGLFPTDRREVQEHHCEGREPGSEEEDQRAHVGKTELGRNVCVAAATSLLRGHSVLYTPAFPRLLFRRTTSGWNRTWWGLRPKWPVCTVRWTRWRRSSLIKASALNGELNIVCVWRALGLHQVFDFFCFRLHIGSLWNILIPFSKNYSRFSLPSNMRNVSKTCSLVLLLFPNIHVKTMYILEKIQYYYRNQSGLSFCQNYPTDRKRHRRQEEDTTQVAVSQWGGGWNRISWSDCTHSSFGSIAWQQERHKQNKTPPPRTISATVFLYRCLSFTDVTHKMHTAIQNMWLIRFCEGIYFLMVCLF